MQIQDALERFLVQLEADGRSAHTRKQYERHIRLLARWLDADGHGGEIETIDHERLARFLVSDAARARPDGRAKKAASTNALRTSVRCFFSYVHAAGWTARNPARLVRRAICSPPPPRALSEAEQKRLLEVLAAADDERGRRDHALFHLMLATGIRVGSAVALDVEDVDLEAGELRLRTMKGDRSDVVYLGAAIRDHLRGFLGERTTGPLFVGRVGRRLTTRHVARRLCAWTQRASIARAASPHALRHSFGTDLYRRSGNILLVKEALRHRSIASTAIYARQRPESLRAFLS